MASVSASKVSTIVMVMLLFCAVSSNAQNSPGDYLSAHNQARAEVGVGALQWDTAAAEFAQWWANQLAERCLLGHSDQQLRRDRDLGENVYWSSATSATAADAVKLWVNEKKHYDVNTGTCVDCTQNFRAVSCESGECRHYTQVVWRKTQQLGCARAACRNGRGLLVVCNYKPAGNMQGERPY